jgi:glycosyltransferase involved in cell wall biosynthesis
MFTRIFAGYAPPMSADTVPSPERLHIAMISENASPWVPADPDGDGQRLHVEALSSALARRGHDLRVYTRDPAGGTDGVKVVPVPAGQDFAAWLGRCWAGQAPDVVHAHFWTSGVAALRAQAPVPLVTTFHTLASPGPADPAGRAAQEAMVARAADQIIAQTSGEVRELLRLGARRTQIRVVPPGVDVESFRPGPDGPGLRPPSRPARILCVGPMAEDAGFDDAVTALRGLPGVHLVIAGGPPLAELRSHPLARGLRQAAAEAGVADRVQLLGAVPRAEMPRLYRSVDVLVCTPAGEPSGLAPIEAMACGTPVVAYAAGGLADSVAHGVSGMLVEPGDIPSLVVALRDLLDCEPRRFAYAAAAASQAQARYPWSLVSEQVEAVYRSTRPAVAAGRT